MKISYNMIRNVSRSISKTLREQSKRGVHTNSNNNSLEESGKKRWVATWGNGDYGRLGHGELASKARPSVCKKLQDHQPLSIACGGAHTLILTEQRRVFSAGLNDFGQLGVSTDTTYSLEPVEVVGLPEDIKMVFAGYYHSSAITEDGIVYVWGCNNNSQLGLGKGTPKRVFTARKVEALNGLKIASLALGSTHSLAITEDGKVLSWGSGEYGTLGHGHQSRMFNFFGRRSEHTPKLIGSLENYKIFRIAAGLTHSACIGNAGIVMTFGQGTMYQLGLGEVKENSIPSAVEELPLMSHIACGGYHTCGISINGEVYCWGLNENGCLGLRSMMSAPFPERLEGKLSDCRVSEVSCGWKHTAAISDGRIFTWGWSGSYGGFFDDSLSSGGQLGHGNQYDYPEPTQIKFDTDLHAVQISCGFNHTGAILEEK